MSLVPLSRSVGGTRSVRFLPICYFPNTPTCLSKWGTFSLIQRWGHRFINRRHLWWLLREHFFFRRNIDLRRTTYPFSMNLRIHSWPSNGRSQHSSLWLEISTRPTRIMHQLRTHNTHFQNSIPMKLLSGRISASNLWVVESSSHSFYHGIILCSYLFRLPTWTPSRASHLLSSTESGRIASMIWMDWLFYWIRCFFWGRLKRTESLFRMNLISSDYLCHLWHLNTASL